MAGQWKSVLGGAFVAALLILPAAAGDNDWITGPWRSFDAKDLKVDGLVGKLRVDVKPQSQITVQISGQKARVDSMSVHTSGSTLVISGDTEDGVWDWHNWFDFSENHNNSKALDVHVVVPKGTDVHVDDMVGDATIGDIEGDIHFEAAASNATIGRTKDAHVSMAGSGKIVMAPIAGDSSPCTRRSR